MVGLRYFSLLGTSGYAQAARRYLTALKLLGVPVTWTPIVQHSVGWTLFEGRSVGDPELDPICNLPITYDVAVLHLMPHFYPRLVESLPGKRIAAYTVWETDTLPRRWLRFLKNIDIVITPCEWNRKVFSMGGYTRPIEVVPHSLEPGQAPLAERSRDQEEFVFYTINAWSYRKAVDLTIKAFLRAFTPADKVRLVVKTSRRHEMLRIPFTTCCPVSTRWLIERILRGHPDPPPITVITDTVPVAAIKEIHANGDCFVSLTRGEGWGMGACDAAAAGRPVIITGFGGQTEFLPADLAYLVNFRMTRIPFLPAEQFEYGQTWADPDIGHAAALMRHVFENRDESRRRAGELAPRICSAYEHKSVGERLVRALKNHF